MLPREQPGRERVVRDECAAVLPQNGHEVVLHHPIQRVVEALVDAGGGEGVLTAEIEGTGHLGGVIVGEAYRL